MSFEIRGILAKCTIQHGERLGGKSELEVINTHEEVSTQKRGGSLQSLFELCHRPFVLPQHVVAEAEVGASFDKARVESNHFLIFSHCLLVTAGLQSLLPSPKVLDQRVAC